MEQSLLRQVQGRSIVVAIVKYYANEQLVAGSNLIDMWTAVRMDMFCGRLITRDNRGKRMSRIHATMSALQHVTGHVQVQQFRSDLSGQKNNMRDCVLKCANSPNKLKVLSHCARRRAQWERGLTMKQFRLLDLKTISSVIGYLISCLKINSRFKNRRNREYWKTRLVKFGVLFTPAFHSAHESRSGSNWERNKNGQSGSIRSDSIQCSDRSNHLLEYCLQLHGAKHTWQC